MRDTISYAFKALELSLFEYLIHILIDQAYARRVRTWEASRILTASFALATPMNLLRGIVSTNWCAYDMLLKSTARERGMG